MVKKQEKSIEQRLEEVLVLYEKTPYKLPSNWCWVKFTAIIDIKGGNQPPKSQFVEEPRVGYIRFIQIRDYASDKYRTYIPIKENLTLVDKEDILIARYGASLGKICRGIAGACNVALAKTIFDKKNILSDYLFYLLKTEVFQTPLSLLSRTAQAGFNKNDLDNFKFPLAPLEEQRRIVDVIAKQFAKLDEARDLIQKSLDSFAERKSAILHKAFTGELTKRWVRNRGYDSLSWRQTTLNQIARWGSGGTPSRKCADYYKGNIPWVKTGELNNSYIFDTEEKISNKAVDESSAKLYPIGTVIVAMYGATIGQCALLGIEATTNQACACAIVNEKIINNRFLFYYLISQKSKFIALGKGGAQPNISQTIIKDYPISIPSIEEQEEIVRILDSVFEKEDKSKELIDLLDKINEMKKSILARAFRGELGTNNPNDEPAIELLKRILEEKYAI